MKIMFTQTNIINTVVTGSLWTFIHISMVSVAHRSGLANTGKVVPFVAIATSLALRWTGQDP